MNTNELSAHAWSGHIVEIDYETSRFLVRYEGIPPDVGTELADRERQAGEAVARHSILSRATDLHEKSGMPWYEAEELALGEAGIDGHAIDELIGECGYAGLASMLCTDEELRQFTRSVLVHQPTASPACTCGSGREAVAHINQFGLIREAGYEWGSGNDLTPLYASLPAPQAVQDEPMRVALEALQKLDFDMRVTTSEGLPPEACRIIDAALTAAPSPDGKAEQAEAPSDYPQFLLRKCEHCGCETNAKMRACCKAGWVDDKVASEDRAAIRAARTRGEQGGAV